MRRSNPWRNLLPAAALAVAANCGSAPDGAPLSASDTSRDAVFAHLAASAREITQQAMAETASEGAWESVRAQRLAELKEMLGLDFEREESPLNAEVRARIERDGYVIEKIAFESLPRVYVTANLYLPAAADGPVPGVIYVCGHAYSPHGAKTSYQRHGHTLARHGYAAMVIDPVQIAETAGLHHGVFNQEMEDWYTRAYSPAGLEVWNVIRALDYLETRPEVDSERFGITGRSGGAAMSWFAASVEPRIKVAIPIMGIGTYEVSVREDTQRRHCDCMFPVNFRRHDLIHLGALIAPRPLLTAHGRTDPLFPVDGYEAFSAAMAGLYESYGEPSRFRNLVVDSGHSDSDELRAEAVRWLDRWLAEREPREIDTAFEPVEPAELAVYAGRPPADALNYRAHEFFIRAAGPLAPADGDRWEDQRKRLATVLRTSALDGLPQDAPAPTLEPGRLEPIGAFQAVSFRYGERIRVEALLRMPEGHDGPALVHIAGPQEDPASVDRLLRNISRFGSNPVMAVFPPGTGPGTWSKSESKMLLRNAMLAGTSVDAIRIGSALAAVRAVRAEIGSDREVAVSGIGEAAGWALYAAAMDESIAQAILIRAPSSHAEGPVLLAALRHADLPDIAALVAPRRLTFFGGMPPAYARTEAVYATLRAGDRISVSMSIGAALNGRFGHGFALGL